MREEQREHEALLRQWGANVRNRRLAAYLTQEELAFAANVHAKTIRNIELGRHEPNAATRVNIAAALGVTTRTLFPRKKS